MNIKIGPYIISKPVLIRLGLIVFTAIPKIALDWLDTFTFWCLCVPLIVVEIVRQFRIDNGYAEADDAPDQ